MCTHLRKDLHEAVQDGVPRHRTPTLQVTHENAWSLKAIEIAAAHQNKEEQAAETGGAILTDLRRRRRTRGFCARLDQARPPGREGEVFRSTWDFSWRRGGWIMKSGRKLETREVLVLGLGSVVRTAEPAATYWRVQLVTQRAVQPDEETGETHARPIGAGAWAERPSRETRIEESVPCLAPR